MNSALMEEAVELARTSMRAGRGGPFGAILVLEGTRVVGRGANEVLATNDPTAHAEVVAIRSAARALGRFHLPEGELYTTCEPCPMCLGAVYWARLKAVYYLNTRADAARAGFADEFIYQEISTPIGTRKVPFRQMQSSSGDQLLEEWISRVDKTTY